MHTSQIYIALSIIVLAIVGLFAFLLGKRGANRLTPLAGIAFGFVIAGILFGEKRIIGYGLMGIGVILAIMDIVLRSKGDAKE
jgi:hypothetical protein